MPYIETNVDGTTSEIYKKYNKKKRHCNLCNKDISYFNYYHHVKTTKHIFNVMLKTINDENASLKLELDKKI
jgi:hypothetical protein